MPVGSAQNGGLISHDESSGNPGKGEKAKGGFYPTRPTRDVGV